MFGNSIQRFSMSLYLLNLTGSPAVFADILAVSTIPYIIFAPLAGKISDTFNKKYIMVFLDFFCAALIGIYGVMLLKGNQSIIIAGIIMFLLAVCYTFYSPAVTVAVPKIVNEEKLTSANGIINQINSFVNFLGPVFAGIIYGIFGIKTVVFINCFSFLASALMELFLNIPETENRSEIYKKENIFLKYFINPFKESAESFKYLNKEKKVILNIIFSYALCNIILVPALSIAAPYFINTCLDMSSEVYGIVEGVSALGMAAGSVIISFKADLFKMKKVHYTYFPMLAGAFIMCVSGFYMKNKMFSAGAFAFSGFLLMLSIALSNVLTLTYIQKEVPENLLGKVSAFSTAIATISVAPGQILFGQILNSSLGIETVFIISFIADLFLVLYIKKKISLKVL